MIRYHILLLAFSIFINQSWADDTYCSSYSTTGGAYVSCDFTICEATSVTISSCTLFNGYYSGDGVLELYSPTNSLITSNDDYSNERCPAIVDQVLNPTTYGQNCSTFSIHQYCYGVSTCSGTTAIRMYSMNSEPTSYPTVAPAIPTVAPTRAPTVRTPTYRPTLRPSVSPSLPPTSYCPYYSSSSRSNYVSCSFEVCQPATVTVTSCTAYGGTFTGDTYLSLYINGYYLNENDDAPFGGRCSYISETVSPTSGTCATITAQQSCYSSSVCSGVNVFLVDYASSQSPTAAPTSGPRLTATVQLLLDNLNSWNKTTADDLALREVISTIVGVNVSNVAHSSYNYYPYYSYRRRLRDLTSGFVSYVKSIGTAQTTTKPVNTDNDVKVDESPTVMVSKVEGQEIQTSSFKYGFYIYMTVTVSTSYCSYSVTNSYCAALIENTLVTAGSSGYFASLLSSKLSASSNLASFRYVSVDVISWSDSSSTYTPTTFSSSKTNVAAIVGSICSTFGFCIMVGACVVANAVMRKSKRTSPSSAPYTFGNTTNQNGGIQMVAFDTSVGVGVAQPVMGPGNNPYGNYGQVPNGAASSGPVIFGASTNGGLTVIGGGTQPPSYQPYGSAAAPTGMSAIGLARSAPTHDYASAAPTGMSAISLGRSAANHTQTEMGMASSSVPYYSPAPVAAAPYPMTSTPAMAYPAATASNYTPYTLPTTTTTATAFASPSVAASASVPSYSNNSCPYPTASTSAPPISSYAYPTSISNAAVPMAYPVTSHY